MSLSLSSGFSIPWDKKKIIEIRIADTQTMTSKYSSKRKSYPTLNLNHKLDVIKFSKEGMLKAEID